MEIWKDIPGYKNFQVSNRGRVFSKKRVVRSGNGEREVGNKILNPTLDRYGYPEVCLRERGCPHRGLIHRLVAETFIANPDEKPEVNHKDGDKQNNFVDNLEWVTAQENTRHAHELGLINLIKGETHHWSKLSADQVVEIRRRYKQGGITQKELGKEFGVHKECIGDIVRGRNWKHLL